VNFFAGVRQRIGEGSRDPEQVTQSSAGRGRRLRRRVGAIVVGLVGGAVFAFLGFNAYLQAVEWMDPSGRVYIVVDGDKVYLERSNTLVTPVPESPAEVRATPAATAPAAGQAASVGGSIGSPSQAIDAGDAAAEPIETLVPLPPVALEIEKVGVDYPVVVASNAHLPQQPMVGWYYGSALPGTAGNSVLLGHVDGRAATFGRLHEIAVGDEITVITANAEHVYVVDWVKEVDPTDVGVIGPSDQAVVTLVTCAGNWIPDERSYDKRLVVRAHYAARNSRDGG